MAPPTLEVTHESDGSPGAEEMLDEYGCAADAMYCPGLDAG